MIKGQSNVPHGLFAWGRGKDGCLGTGSTCSSAVPIQIMYPPDIASYPILAIATGGFHSLAVSEGTDVVYTWGAARCGQLGQCKGSDSDGNDVDRKIMPGKVDFEFSDGVDSVRCGGSHSAVVTLDGLLYTWGSSSHGQCGTGDLKLYFRPVLVSEFVKLNLKIHSVGCGLEHTAAVTECGKIFTWGDNNDGQLGYSICVSEHSGTRANVPRQVVVGGLNQLFALDVACGDFHTVAKLAVDGGDSHKEFRSRASSRENVSAGGKSVSCHVYAWGSNSFSQCGPIPEPLVVVNGKNSPSRLTTSLSGNVDPLRWTPRPCSLDFLKNKSLQQTNEADAPATAPTSNIVSIGCGAYYTAVLSDDGRVYMCGSLTGQVTKISAFSSRRMEPKRMKWERVMFPAVSILSTGSFHMIAVTGHGVAYVCGVGADGRLGLNDETFVPISAPKSLQFFKNCSVVDVAAGRFHSLAYVEGEELGVDDVESSLRRAQSTERSSHNAASRESPRVAGISAANLNKLHFATEISEVDRLKAELKIANIDKEILWSEVQSLRYQVAEMTSTLDKQTVELQQAYSKLDALEDEFGKKIVSERVLAKKVEQQSVDLASLKINLTNKE